MDRTGKCLCGAVQFTAEGVSSNASACHCGMCLRWAGGPWMGVTVKSIDWQSDGALQVVKSSEWAERGFCNVCGSGLFYRVTAEGKFHGLTSISLGALDDPNGFTLTKEWFIDNKPDAYALEGDRPRLTQADMHAMMAGVIAHPGRGIV